MGGAGPTRRQLRAGDSQEIPDVRGGDLRHVPRYAHRPGERTPRKALCGGI